MQLRSRHTLLGIRENVGVQHLAKRYLMKEVRDAIGSNVATALEQAKGTIFGLMAKNMNERDFNKFFSHWHERLEDSQQQSKSQVIIPTPKTPIVASTTVEMQPSQKAPATSLSSKPIIVPKYNGASFVYHPLLGELVSSIGYKKVYLTNVHALARTPVWKRQRILRPERAALIAEDKIRKGTAHSLPGVITMYQDIATSAIGIIDGQHRAGALMILAQRGYWDEYKNNIAVEVFPTNGEKSIAALFSAINAAEPVRLIDLPDSQEDEEVDEEAEVEKEKQQMKKQEVVAKEVPLKNTTNNIVKEETKDAKKVAQEVVVAKEVNTSNTNTSTNSPKAMKNDATKTVDSVKNSASKDMETATETTSSSSSSNMKSSVNTKSSVDLDRELITSVTEALRTKYPEMFKPTSRCKIPHLNLDVLRDDLFQANVLRLKRFSSAEELLTKLEKINSLLGERLTQLQEDKAKQQGDSRWEMKSFETALEKAKKNGFFLGMEKDWMYDKNLWSKDI